jgi:hypothetical protein
MHLSKPAGVFFQIFGAILALTGFGLTGQSVIGGLIAVAIGGWMVWEGRKPALRSREPPTTELQYVENLITAKGGQITYKVMAYRKMEKGELERAVMEALQSGKLKEPEPGGVATLVTEIGR